MAKALITIVGMNHYHGMVADVGDSVTLKHEPENIYDTESVRVDYDKYGVIGYVANSPKTVVRGTKSAGAIHDKIGYYNSAKIILVTDDRYIAEVELDG